MKIAVVGNREGWKYEDIEKILLKDGVFTTDVIISGGAKGVDTFAQEFAEKYGNKIIIIYPNPKLPSPRRYYERNEKIALECEFMFVFNKGNNPKSGSFNAMNYAKKLGKEIKVIESS
jgi:predicted Rossmann fold nucleotide-binding protein DprA/Smf involved in DNA uptake